MPKYAVEIDNVSKAYHQGNETIHAVRNAHFKIEEGRLQMIVGPSGSGKTTLLSIIAGVLYFDSGEIKVLGQSLHAMNEDAVTEFRKKSIGFIFQQFNLIPTISCAENVAIPLMLNGVSYQESIKRAKNFLARVGLGDRATDSPRNLSGGQQQRVAIVRALIHDPKIVICDEPTASLDAETGGKIMELLREIAKEDRTVVIVTHDDRIFKFADHVAKMSDGVIQE